MRQLASRARAHVAAGAPRLDVDAADHRRTVEAFLAATAGGDLAGLLAVLDPDVVLTSDGGGIALAARRPVLGADRVARLLLGAAHRQPVVHRAVTINGQAGYATTDPDGRLLAVCALSVRRRSGGPGRPGHVAGQAPATVAR